MIFPRNKLVPVKYIIDMKSFEEWSVAKGLFPGMEKQKIALDIGCPAIASVNNKLFDIWSPFSFEIKFGRDEEGAAYWNYEFDTKEHPWSAENWSAGHSVRDVLNRLITHSAPDGKSFALQFGLPYALVTDDPDLSVTVLPPHGVQYENCYFVSGEFLFADWIRGIASAWILEDASKEATIRFEVNKPCVSLYFNKQITLSYTNTTEEIADYKAQMQNAAFYKTNAIGSLFEVIKSRRPKRLLAKN